MRIINKLKSGDFNNMSQERQPDSSVIITLTKRGDSHIYKIAIKDLYGENEEVLWQKIQEIEQET